MKNNEYPTALIMLNALILEGWEFPEAACKAAQKFGIDQQELERQYDDQWLAA